MKQLAIVLLAVSGGFGLASTSYAQPVRIERNVHRQVAILDDAKAANLRDGELVTTQGRDAVNDGLGGTYRYRRTGRGILTPTLQDTEAFPNADGNDDYLEKINGIDLLSLGVIPNDPAMAEQNRILVNHFRSTKENQTFVCTHVPRTDVGYDGFCTYYFDQGFVMNKGECWVGETTRTQLYFTGMEPTYNCAFRLDDRCRISNLSIQNIGSLGTYVNASGGYPATTPYTGVGIKLATSTARWVMENVAFAYFDIGVNINEDSWIASMHDCTIGSCTTAFKVNTGKQLINFNWTGGEVGGNVDYIGIDIDGILIDVKFDSIAVEGCNEYGIHMDGINSKRNVTIDNCYFEGLGIWRGDADGSRYEGQGRSIFVDGTFLGQPAVTSLRISNCGFHDSGVFEDVDIEISEAFNPTLFNNQFPGDGGNGLYNTIIGSDVQGATITPGVWGATGSDPAAREIISDSGQHTNIIGGEYLLSERSSNPTDPTEGRAVLWQSDGTGVGLDGDVLLKSTFGGATSHSARINRAVSRYADTTANQATYTSDLVAADAWMVEFYDTTNSRLQIWNGTGWQHANEHGYGEIQVEGNATSTTISGTDSAFGANAVQFTGFDTNAPESYNTTPDHTNDHITISDAGFWKIECTLSVISPLDATYSFALFKNNKASQETVRATQFVTGGAVHEVVTVSGLLSCSASDTIELWLQNESGTEDPVIVDAVMTVTKVSD